jgi:hypothetical protein
MRIRTRDPSNEAASDLRLRPRGTQDRQLKTRIVISCRHIANRLLQINMEQFSYMIGRKNPK